MLTKARLIQLGFIEKSNKGQTYLQNGNFYLFESGVGCWSGGYNDGEFAVLENGLLICAEDQLREVMKNGG